MFERGKPPTFAQSLFFCLQSTMQKHAKLKIVFFRLFICLQMNQCRLYGLFVLFWHESNVQFVLFSLSLSFDIFCDFSLTPLISLISLSESALERFPKQLYILHVHDRDERISLMSLEPTLQHLCIKAHTQDSRH